MILVSVIIPAYKRVDQTLRTIELLLSSEGINTDFSLEIIVSDSSPDHLLHEKVNTRFGSAITYIHPDREGIAANKNFAARHALHPLIIFCDSDMEVEGTTLKNTITALKNHQSAGAVTGTIVWKGGPGSGSNDRPRSEDRQYQRGETMFVETIYSRFVATYKDIFFRVGGYDEAVFNMRGEGSDLSIRYWREGFPLVYDPTIVAHHVHEVEGGIIRGVAHPEWGIARDLVLLAYKYHLSFDKSPNFNKTVSANFASLNGDSHARIIYGIANNLDYILMARKKIDDSAQSTTKHPVYDFTFLDVFTNESLLLDCLSHAKEKIAPYRKNIWVT